jgi:hypothetical protein
VTRHGTHPTTAANAIELRIEKIAQLFHSLDPFPFRKKDLDIDVEESIVGWARELPPDKPLGIVIHLPETEASTSEAHELGAAFAQYCDRAPESLRSILTSSFASADQRWPFIIGQTAVNLAPGPIGRVIEESLLVFGWAANCINNFRRRM